MTSVITIKLTEQQAHIIKVWAANEFRTPENLVGKLIAQGAASIFSCEDIWVAKEYASDGDKKGHYCETELEFIFNQIPFLQ
jgi:hypothetical protein